MRLQTRLVLMFLLLAWFPLGAAVWLLTDRMETTFAESLEQRRASLAAVVAGRFHQVSRDLSQALSRMAADPLLETELLQPLAREQFYGDQERERAIVREAERLITSPAVDTLRLVDLERGGRVVAMGHRRGEEPPDEEAVRIAREHPQTPLLRTERLENRETGTADRVWTLQVVRLASPRVALVGGRLLDEELVGALLVGSAGDEAAVALDVRGERVAATFEGAAPPGSAEGYHVAETTLTNPGDDEPVATLRVYVSRAGLTDLLRQLWLTAGVLASGSALLALVAGVWISRRLSRPLERLAAAATEVAAGSRAPTLPAVKGRDEVAQLTRAFGQMASELAEGEERLRQSERVAAWREIARRIAHEIKNPLFPIQMSIETLQKVWRRKHPDFEEIFDESTATILEEVDRMKRIVTEFSDFARMPAPERVPTDVAEVARQVVSLHAGTAPEVEMTASGAASLMAVLDPDQLRQALMNLVLNAIEAMQGRVDGAGGRLEVRVEARPGDRARLVVTDTGPGMDDETLQRLFTPYFTTKATGTGLGLAIVHRIAEEHGGTVRVDSRVGVGTRFVVELPRRSSELRADAA